MAGRSTTQLQVSAHRFELRRIERALLCGSVRPEHEPSRARSSLVAGSVLAAVLIGGCAVLAVVQRPAPDSAPILRDRQSGALYVRVGGRPHPVLNLASARLIAASDADPQPVGASELDRPPPGPLLGIRGAPQTLGAPLPDTAMWSVCDSAGAAGPTTTVIAADNAAPGTALDPEQPVAVTGGPAAAPYLLYRGRRTIAPQPVGPVARPVSGLLLNAIPEAAPTDNVADVAATAAPTSTLCVTWARLPDGRADVMLRTGAGPPLPADAVPVTVAHPDGAGARLDVYLPPGRSAYVHAAGLSPRAGGERYLIDHTGVRFPIGDDEAAHSLGLPATAAPAPWPVLVALPTGPQLSRQHALTRVDVVGAGLPGNPGP